MMFYDHSSRWCYGWCHILHPCPQLHPHHYSHNELKCSGGRLQSPLAALVGGIPARVRTSGGGSRTLNESSYTPARSLNVDFKCSIWKLSRSVPSRFPYQVTHHVCSSCGGNNAPNSLSFDHCLPQYLWGWAASLLEHDQGAQTHSPSPVWCVIKSQGFSSGWAGRQTQAGPSDADSYEGWRHRCGLTVLEQAN